MAQPSPDPFWTGPIGVDVSKYQGDVKWSMVHGAGYEFAYIKASEGKGYTDPKFKTNWLSAREAGMLVGAYHFARVSKSPTIEDDARAEAEWFAGLLGAQPGSHVMLPPVLDIEWDKNADKVIKGAEAIQWCLTFTQTVALLLGRTPTIYTGANFWKWRLLRTSKLAHLPLWQVHYTSAKKPTEIPNWPWTFWQWSYTQPLPGSGSTKVDANRFVGTPTELRKLADPSLEAREPIDVVHEIPWWDKLLEITNGITRAISEPSRRGG